MSKSHAQSAIGAAFGPVLWGTTFIVFTKTLPTDYPLLISALRALPAGLLLLLLVRRLPPPAILFPVTLLALTNIGLFFALLLISAARLPGGVTATLIASQPLFVTLLAWPLLSQRPSCARLLLAIFGIVGVGLIVMDGGFIFDPIGVFSGVGAALSMAFGVVLTDRWRNLAQPMQMTTWQLLIAGAALLPIAFLTEGLPAEWDAQNSMGMAYMVLFATAIGYWLWIRGLQKAGNYVAIFIFLTPVVAFILGILFLEERFSFQQFFGILIVLFCVSISVAIKINYRNY